MWVFIRRGMAAVLVLCVLPAFLAGCGIQAGSMAETEPAARQVPNVTGSLQQGETAPAAFSEEKAWGVILDTVVDVFRKPDTHSERVTQAIYNQPVEILGRQEGWMQVRVVDGYEGWIKEKYIIESISSIHSPYFNYRLVITSKTNRVYAKPGSISLKDVVMGTELYVLNKEKGYYEVALPGSRNGWVNESGVMQLGLTDSIPETTALDFVTTASKLKGTIYLWGGVSARGLDSSGLTYICSRVNGIDLPRDADMQYTSPVGEKVEGGIEAMNPGDLLFFSSEPGSEAITHVAIYTGDSQFLHAGKSRGAVITGTLEDNYYKTRLVGVKRLFGG